MSNAFMPTVLRSIRYARHRLDREDPFVSFFE